MMAKFREIKAGTGIYEFYCPGCKETHQVWTKPNETPCWGFNGNTDSPTVSPSLLVTMPNKTVIGRNDICHSFIKDGMIQFLGDCTHELKGQTIELPDIC